MTDRLSQIKARHAEAGGGDADKQWLIEQVENLRAKLKEYEDFTAAFRQAYEPGSNTAQAVLDEALNTGNGSYKP